MRRAVMTALFCLGLIAVSGMLSTPAFATSYDYYTLEDGHETVAYGIDSAGTAVIRNEAFCSSGFGICYTEFVNGQETTSSDTVFPLMYVNGTSCDTRGGIGLCNNGFDVYEAASGHALYGGMDGMEAILPYSDGADLRNVYLNSAGDILYSSGLFDESYEAITTTPEPSTLLLMGSGLLGVAGTLRRRLVRG